MFHTFFFRPQTSDFRLRAFCSVIIFFFAVCVYFPIPTSAAADIIDRVQEKYSQVETIQANFTQNTYIELLERHQTRMGKLYFGRNRFRIDYLEPEKQNYIFDGQTLWIYFPKFKEVEVYHDADRRISREALSFLSGLGELRSAFKIPSVKSDGAQTTLSLVPKDKESHLKKIQLKLDTKTFELKEATLWPKRGNRSYYVFSQLEFDQKVPDKLFKFRPPKNVTIIKQNAF